MKLFSIFFSAIMYCLTTCTMDLVEQPKPVLFDALEPIITYDGKTPATIHPAYKQKVQQEPTFSLIVPAIQHYRTIPDNWHLIRCRFYTALALGKKQDADVKTYMKEYDRDAYYTESSEVTIDDLVYHVKKICGSLYISPQTAYAVKQTYRHIAHGHYIDLTDPRLAYNSAQEECNIKTLTNLLSPTLHVLIGSAYEYYKITFIKPIFYRIILQRHDKKSDLSWQIRSLALGSSGPIISPQSVVKAMEEYNTLLDGYTIMPYTPYDQDKELAQLMEIGNRFPPELGVKKTTITTYHYKNLVFQAFALQHPQYEKMLAQREYGKSHHKDWNIVYHLQNVIHNDRWPGEWGVSYDQLCAEPIVQQFIDSFTAPQQIETATIDEPYDYCAYQ